MPMDKSCYPANWDEISRRIRFERAGNRCEWCGRENGSIKWKDITCNGVLIGLKRIVVVLTVHHKGVPKPDGTPGDRHDKMDCRDENLVALCQSCHWKADWDIHKFNQLESKRQRKLLSGQGELFHLEGIRPK